MKTNDLKTLSVKELIEQFKQLTLAQSHAELYGQYSKYNKLYRKVVAIKDELKSREGDQRRALVELFDHQNAQVRLVAAQWALAVVPEAAQAVLQKISDQNEYPQAADARQTLDAIKRGDSKLM